MRLKEMDGRSGARRGDYRASESTTKEPLELYGRGESRMQKKADGKETGHAIVHAAVVLTGRAR